MIRPHSSEPQDSWYETFHDLMPFRVREILLVSSPYDAFTLEEDGRLTERLFTEFSELNLSMAPRITHVATGARAMELLAQRRFDLVLTMVRIADTDVSAFARQVKRVYPEMPLVLLVLTEADLRAFPGGVDRTAIDHVFWWTGDARILLAIIKLVEDAHNVAHDTACAGVRVIVVVEDSIRRYSSFLSLLYAELMLQSSSLVAEGVNDLHRLMRMRARPKLLLANTYEEAIALFQRYAPFIIALISDVRFPRGGEEDPQAGFELLREVRASHPDLAVLVQSAEPENAARAEALGVLYADKSSSNLLKTIRAFVKESLGFGEFVFRLPDRTEVARAGDMFELEERLRTIPAASLEFHATRNHFSLWLMARCAFGLAQELRPRRIEEFGSVEALRAYLLKVLEDARTRQQAGAIADASSGQAKIKSPFVRLGTGSIGGKARGLAFVSSLLARRGIARRFPGLAIRVPRSVAVSTDEFDRFMESNRVLEAGGAERDPAAVLRKALLGRLDDELKRDLREALSAMRGPLAVRSSSLLEDSQLQPFAGVYATYMLPNVHPDPNVRAAEVQRAIKAVFASVYSADAQATLAGTPYSIEEEKMAVLVQQVVGRAYGSRFYPTISGLALSYNHYPIGHQRAEDGLVMLALGLGQTVVQGRTAMQFSPAVPSVLPQFGSPREYLQYSQRTFYALDLSRPVLDFARGDDASLREYDLAAAEEDGTLALVGSTYDPTDDVIRDTVSGSGPRLVTFHTILKWNVLPLAEALQELLGLLGEGLGCPVEIEFAVDLPPPSRVEPGEGEPSLYVLQVRPQASLQIEGRVETQGFPREQVLCITDRSLGHGVIEGLRDIVWVTRTDLQATETPAVARQVGALNARLVQERAPYLLVGPGRWGSSDPRLGIPVRWADIAGARVIVETEFDDRVVEPSQGAHFFHNVTSFRLGYLTLTDRAQRVGSSACVLDRAWLLEQPVLDQQGPVRHLRLERPLRVFLDGREGRATILKS